MCVRAYLLPRSPTILCLLLFSVSLRGNIFHCAHDGAALPVLRRKRTGISRPAAAIDTFDPPGVKHRSATTAGITLLRGSRSAICNQQFP